MRISKRDTMLLYILAGLMLFLLSYVFIVSSFQQKTDEVMETVYELRPEVASLEEKFLNITTYENETKRLRTAVNDELKAFPTDIKEEDMLSYLISLEGQNGITIESVTFDYPYLLGEFNGVVFENGVDNETTLGTYRAGAVMTAYGDYSNLKDVIDFINKSPEMTELDSVAAAYNSERNTLAISVQLSKLYVTWDGAKYVPKSVPAVDMGVADLFGTN